MKVCIITLYKTYNSGSYLQAYALKTYIEQQGHEVYFLKMNYPLKSKIEDRFIIPIKKLLRHGIKSYKQYLNSIKEFKRLQNELNIINYNDAMKSIDVFIFGSDTIWDIGREKLYKLKDVFFGIKFKGKKKVSYAASFANTKYESIINNSDILDSLKEFSSISVRDEYSSSIIERTTSIRPTIVCDPTILLNKEDYNTFINSNNNNKYIFSYLFDDLNTEQKEDIKAFAKKNKLKIYGIRKFDWCDDVISNYPDNFISYLKNSEYVITDTFHGVIFSTIFNKKYVAIDRHKNKVNDFLKSNCLSNRLLDNQNIVEVLTSDIEFKVINKCLEDSKKKSIDFLNNSINKSN